jgi:hypothetical protein
VEGIKSFLFNNKKLSHSILKFFSVFPAKALILNLRDGVASPPLKKGDLGGFKKASNPP